MMEDERSTSSAANIGHVLDARFGWQEQWPAKVNRVHFWRSGRKHPVQRACCGWAHAGRPVAIAGRDPGCLICVWGNDGQDSNSAGEIISIWPQCLPAACCSCTTAGWGRSGGVKTFCLPAARKEPACRSTVRISRGTCPRPWDKQSRPRTTLSSHSAWPLSSCRWVQPYRPSTRTWLGKRSNLRLQTPFSNESTARADRTMGMSSNAVYSRLEGELLILRISLRNTCLMRLSLLCWKTGFILRVSQINDCHSIVVGWSYVWTFIKHS